MGYLGLIWFKR